MDKMRDIRNKVILPYHLYNKSHPTYFMICDEELTGALPLCNLLYLEEYTKGILERYLDKSISLYKHVIIYMFRMKQGESAWQILNDDNNDRGIRTVKRYIVYSDKC